jgi:hypothetical protein
MNDIKLCPIHGAIRHADCHGCPDDAPLTSKTVTAVEAFKVLVEEIDATGVYLDGPKDAVKFIAECVSSALTKLIQRESSADETTPDDARDAARYRYLRERLACDRLAARKLVITTEGGREPYRTLREAELDREIDECIGSSVEPTPVPASAADPASVPRAGSAVAGGPAIDWPREVTAILEGVGVRAIRVREGGGPEDLAMSLAVTMAKLAPRP